MYIYICLYTYIYIYILVYIYIYIDFDACFSHTRFVFSSQFLSHWWASERPTDLPAWEILHWAWVKKSWQRHRFWIVHCVQPIRPEPQSHTRASDSWHFMTFFKSSMLGRRFQDGTVAFANLKQIHFKRRQSLTWSCSGYHQIYSVGLWDIYFSQSSNFAELDNSEVWISRWLVTLMIIWNQWSIVSWSSMISSPFVKHVTCKGACQHCHSSVWLQSRHGKTEDMG